MAAKHGLKNTAKLPIDPGIATAFDTGKMEEYRSLEIDRLTDALLENG